MVILNWGKTRTALFLAGSHADIPTYGMLGSGSGTVAITQTTLISGTDRQAITVANGSTTFKVRYTMDWNSVEMSGVPIKTLWEWGMITSGTGLTGSMWSRTAMPSAITFDGTTELRIEETWEVY